MDGSVDVVGAWKDSGVEQLVASDIWWTEKRKQ